MSLKLSPKVSLLLVSLFATGALLSCQQAPPPTSSVVENKTTPAATDTAKKAAPVDLEAVADRLVTQVAGVEEGEIVFVSGGVRDMELLENLTTDVRKVGAFPMLTVNSDRQFKKYYEEVPEKYDSQAPDLDLKLATLPAVTINIDSSESDNVAEGISPARQAAVGKANEGVADLYLKRNVRSVGIGNGLYPTLSRPSDLACRRTISQRRSGKP